MSDDLAKVHGEVYSFVLGSESGGRGVAGRWAKQRKSRNELQETSNARPMPSLHRLLVELTACGRKSHALVMPGVPSCDRIE